MTKSKAAARPPPAQAPPSQTNRSKDEYSPTHSVDSSPPLGNADSASAKKKKKKGKGKRIDDDFDTATPLNPVSLNNGQAGYQTANGTIHPSHGAFNASAQAQADLLATASDLYRRIESDPTGIPDDDAYWTSLPAHLRTFIRNALPIGQFPATGANDVNARHASTQAMIAVAQQLAQAAHASQRHLQQYPPGSQPYPSLPFDPAIFADLALHSDQSIPHSHTNGVHGQGPFGHVHYAGVNPPPSQAPGESLPNPMVLVNEYGEEAGDYDDEYYSDEDIEGPDGLTDALQDGRDGAWPPDQMLSQAMGNNGHVEAAPQSAKKNKKKKKKKSGTTDAAVNAVPPAPVPQQTRPQPPVQQQQNPPPPPATTAPRSAGPPPSSRAAGKQPMTFNSNPPAKSAAVPNGHNHGRLAGSRGSSNAHPAPAAQAPAKVWSMSTAEERERIKNFWSALGDRERRNLVQVEKEAVLRKMKEHQKQHCGCAVCGRKRSAIESELEALYRAYFDELQQFAQHQQQYVKSGGTIPPPAGPGPFPGSVVLDSAGNVVGGNALTKNVPVQKTRVTPPPIKKMPPSADDDEGYDDELDDEYDDEYDEEDEDDDDDVLPDSHRRRGGAHGHGHGGSAGPSLTVKGGILTVADDLLRNDGQKFLEMMEQLADRRMQREGDAARDFDAASEDGDNDADDLDDGEDDALTDEQRMEEGRRMFQVFAARLFEQRVLSSYRERVAQERQLQLLRELEEEDQVEKDREAKKQKENQKKKDKKKQQQLKKEEERVKRESEKAAEEAAAREKVEKQRAEELRKQEELRLKREKERQAKEEERLRKEEEKRKRQEEERAREAERERKRKEKEDKARLEREAREAKETEARAKEEEARRQRELKEKEELERKAKEEQDRLAQEAAQKEKEKAEKAAAAAAAKAKAAAEEKKAAAAKAQQSASAAPSATPTSPAVPRGATGPSPNSPRSAAPSARARQASVPPSPATAAPVMYARPPQIAPSSSIPPRPPTAPSQAPKAQAAPAASSGSSLPAPPQGLPARPSAKAAAHGAGSSAIATAPDQNASAPGARPSGAPSAAPPAQSASAAGSFGNHGPAAFGTNAASKGSGGAPIGSPLSPPAGASSGRQTPAPIGSNGASSQTASSSASATGFSFGRGGFPAAGFGPNGAPTFDAMRAANSMSNAMASPLALGYDSNSSPMSVNAAASSLSHLHLGSQTGAQPGGPIGPSRSSPHGIRGASEEPPSTGSQSSPSSLFRAAGRPGLGPIGPIGRPRAGGSQGDDYGGLHRSDSPRLPDGILGSAALGSDDDDELFNPQPRRTSNSVTPIGGSALHGFGSAGSTSANPGSSQAFSPSPWMSSAYQSPGISSPLSSNANSFASLGASAAPVSSAGGSSVGAGGSGLGSASIDPWAPLPPVAHHQWTAARYAFEGQQGQSQSQGQPQGSGQGQSAGSSAPQQQSQGKPSYSAFADHHHMPNHLPPGFGTSGGSAIGGGSGANHPFGSGAPGSVPGSGLLGGRGVFDPMNPNSSSSAAAAGNIGQRRGDHRGF